MAFRKNDSPLYFKVAHDAVHLEQSGQYHEPARAWSQANRLARNRNNRIWSENRTDFCLMQIKRMYSCS
ncbi:hypothetical protein ARAF_0844 [Arsenophonus endosymbiont of Aleurodicus floccissimus]|uniref:ANR family transcriptional regulator n=1 Tax=Arsenophonus endosymbiont of Aleurodicus floccissimus TaxID=2152761 RepID=UPI000E6B181A|nr:ANR family transcriptional regulator [Arsenophonus endosymbiont of Aleurodicus floccissimus]SPP31702.1 hypothetical protein ARAF_0844 [Arsenophonus endosymbiont of Aleurodicus floccissimus]